jgi:hypothetical protein
LIVIADSQQIQIAGRAQRIFEPLRKEHRSLQNEALAILGLTQAIEKALKNIVVEQQIEGLPARFERSSRRDRTAAPMF